MAYAVQWIRSLLFNIQMYVAMVIVAIVFLVPMILSQKGLCECPNREILRSGGAQSFSLSFSFSFSGRP